MIPVFFVLFVAFVVPAPPSGMVVARAAGCDPEGDIRFVCDQAGPEDLVAVPGSAWLIASAYGAEGGLNLIDTKAAVSTRLYPSATATERPDTKTYDSCPGPLQGADRERFRTHGLYLKPGRTACTRSTSSITATANRSRCSSSTLDRNRRRDVDRLRGGAGPDRPQRRRRAAGRRLRRVELRPAVRPRRTRRWFSPALLEGRPNGELWEWHTGRGWAKVPGSEAAGANGLEISKDGKWYYVAEWGNRSFMRLSRGQTPAKRDEISLGFRVDNVRWAPDGSLFVAGQGGGGRRPWPRCRGRPPVVTSVIGKVDPKTMKYQEIVNYPTSQTVSFATVAVQVGNELWVGSAFGDRVARYPSEKK